MSENIDENVIIKSSSDDNLGDLLLQTCASLLSSNELVDCTISCMDGQVQAHRIVLSSASTYVYNLLRSTPLPTPCSHPILFLRNSTVQDVQAAIKYIYTGEVQLPKSNLEGLLDVCNELGCSSLRKAIGLVMSDDPDIDGELGTSKEEFGDSDENEEGNDHMSFSSPMISIVKTEIITDEEDDLQQQEKNDSNGNNDVGDLEGDDAHEKATVTSTPQIARLMNPFPMPTYLNSNPKKRKKILQPQPQQMQKKKIVPGLKRSLPKLTPAFNNGNGLMMKNSFQLHHDKSESFVYTNDDFGGMKHEDEEVGDGIESNEDGMLEEFQNPMEDYDLDNNMDVSSSGVAGRNTPIVPKIDELLKGIVKDEDGADTASQCPWCMQVFTSVTLLQRHIKTHVNNYRPFKCDYCHNSFARSAHLKRHLRTHTGEKPYVCSICQRAFARQDKLKGHLERHVHHATKPTTPTTSTNGNGTLITPSFASSSDQLPIKVYLPKTNPTPISSRGLDLVPQKNFSNHHFLNNNRFGVNKNGLSISLATSSNNNESHQARSTNCNNGLIVTPAHLPPSITFTTTNGEKTSEKMGAGGSNRNFMSMNIK